MGLNVCSLPPFWLLRLSGEDDVDDEPALPCMPLRSDVCSRLSMFGLLCCTKVVHSFEVASRYSMVFRKVLPEKPPMA